MGKKLKITKIELETSAKKKISLTIDEARELHDQLHEFFGSKDVVFVPSAPSYPIIIERDRYPWTQPCYTPQPIYTTTTDSTTTTMIGCSVAGDSGLSVSYKSE